MGSTYWNKRVPGGRKKIRQPIGKPKAFKSEEAAKQWAEKQGL